MFIVRYINSAGKEEGSANTDSSERVIEELKRTLERLKMLPPGAKIEIKWVELLQTEE